MAGKIRPQLQYLSNTLVSAERSDRDRCENGFISLEVFIVFLEAKVRTRCGLFCLTYQKLHAAYLYGERDVELCPTELIQDVSNSGCAAKSLGIQRQSHLEVTAMRAQCQRNVPIEKSSGF